ncbi:MAG: putative 26S proteasome regulatory subunit [Vezdaea aestivalis]|nr:MAG: putative 26S proteasome regulatory subunit [Vezdaea aestivalis]
MDDIHAPTVPSGPTSSWSATNGSGKTPKTLFELMEEKDNVEAELYALGDVLESHGVNMNTSLITFDGYPRDDIDIAQIRTTRARIIRLKNDHKTLMSKIESGLHDHYASLNSQQESQQTASTSRLGNQRTTATSTLPDTPFAKINSVTPNSPADRAGLKQGDAIRNFGSVNWMNHERLSKVAEEVQRDEGRVVLVKVWRTMDGLGNSEDVEVRLVPRRDWGGRGLLGCHIIPV